MPFTPFHLGPGALFKAVAERHFSFMVFGGSQVLMDIEPLVRIYRQDAVLYGPAHTLLGALGIGVVAGVMGKPASETVLRWMGLAQTAVSWPVSFISAFTGTYSHIFLDAIMHRDMKPFWPLVDGNPLLQAVPVETLRGLRRGRGSDPRPRRASAALQALGFSATGRQPAGVEGHAHVAE